MVFGKNSKKLKCLEKKLQKSHSFGFFITCDLIEKKNVYVQSLKLS